MVLIARFFLIVFLGIINFSSGAELTARENDSALKSSAASVDTKGLDRTALPPANTMFAPRFLDGLFFKNSACWCFWMHGQRVESANFLENKTSAEIGKKMISASGKAFLSNYGMRFLDIKKDHVLIQSISDGTERSLYVVSFSKTSSHFPKKKAIRPAADNEDQSTKVFGF